MATTDTRLFDADGHDREVEFSSELVASLKEHQLLWVDVDRSSTDGVLDKLASALDLDGVDLERIRSENGRARLSRTSMHLFLTVQSLEGPEGTTGVGARHELDLIAGHNVVVTVHDGPLAAIDRYREGLTGETRLGSVRAADLLSSLLDEVFNGYFHVIERIEREIDQLDARALRGGHNEDVLGAIVGLRRQIGVIRGTVAPHRDAFAALARPEMRAEETIGQPWPGLMDRLERVLDAIDTLRDALLGTFDIHMARAAQRANDVMKVLTLLSAVLLPSVVLAGIMGMNFPEPFFDDPTNFAIVIVSMVFLAVATLMVARWRRWI